MRLLFKLAIAPALVVGALALAGCDPQVGVKLPHAQQYYVTCFNKLTTIPLGSLTRDKIVQLVAQLRHSELRKSQCGKDLLGWYAKVSAAYGK